MPDKVQKDKQAVDAHAVLHTQNWVCLQSVLTVHAEPHKHEQMTNLHHIGASQSD